MPSREDIAKLAMLMTLSGATIPLSAMRLTSLRPGQAFTYHNVPLPNVPYLHPDGKMQIVFGQTGGQIAQLMEQPCDISEADLQAMRERVQAMVDGSFNVMMLSEHTITFESGVAKCRGCDQTLRDLAENPHRPCARGLWPVGVPVDTPRRRGHTWGRYSSVCQLCERTAAGEHIRHRPCLPISGVPQLAAVGTEEGDLCLRSHDGGAPCLGKLVISTHSDHGGRACCCGPEAPPCSWCMAQVPACPACGWEGERP